MATHPPKAKEQDYYRRDEHRDKVEVQVDVVEVGEVVLDVDFLGLASRHHAHGEHRS